MSRDPVRSAPVRIAPVRVAPVRIAMWSGPRNISTTLMRSFENRPDTAVIDEPFYAHYLTVSGAPHPMRDAILESQPRDRAGVTAWLNGPAPDGSAIVFHKHIGYHVADDPPLDLDWILPQRTFLLIRDPRAMVASFVRKYDDVAPITGSLAVQTRLLEFLEARGRPCPVIDATDVLRNPRGMLTALCRALDIPFAEQMLSWPAGPRASDGVWAPHWYDAVWQSTGFKPYEDREITLSRDLEAVAMACDAPYRRLHARRLTA